MDSDTFTCSNCGRERPAAERVDPPDSDLCTDCHRELQDENTADGSEGEDQSDATSSELEAEKGAEESRDTRLSDGVDGVSASDPSKPPEQPQSNSRPDTEDISPQGGVFWDPNSDQELRTAGSAPDSAGTSDPGSRKGDSLDRRIDSWKEQLLDLTRRNTLVDFSETKTKTLPLTGITPPSVATALLNGELRIHKRPGSDAEPDLNESEVLSTRSPEQTAESLYRIGLNEKQYLRERGVDTLYLVLGALEWYAPDEPGDPYESPLFLAAVDLEQQPVSGKDLHNYVIEPEEDELLINPALRKKLSGEYNLQLPTNEAIGLECIDAAFQAVADQIDGFDNWTIQDDLVLGVFDFAKYSIYSDLEQNRQEIREDPFVQALDDDPAALQEVEADIETVPADAIDDVVDPADVYQVLDADSSQQAAIEAAKRGRSIVIQGPPGTGKSQTISNIIAEKLAAGETVLFVSEKQAALNVVKDRLDDVGVGRFCLEAHGRKATKSNVLGSLEEEIKSNPVKEAPDRSEKLNQYEDRRDILNGFGEALLSAPPGFGITPHEAFGTVASHQTVPDIDIGIDNPLSLDQEAYDAATDGLEELSYFDTEIANYNSHLWRHTQVSQWKVDTANRVEQTVHTHEASIADLERKANEFAQTLGIEIVSCAQFQDAVDLAEHLDIRPDIEWQRQHFAEEFVRLGGRLAEFANQMQRIEGLRTELRDGYHDSFLEADGAELHRTASRYGAFKFLRPGYYSTKNELLSHTQDAYDPSFTELTEDARKLMELQQLQRSTDEYQDVRNALGPLYDGKQTEWGSVLEAREWVARLTEFPFDSTDIVDALIEDELPDISTLHEEAAASYDDFESSDTAFREIMAVEEIRVDGEPLYETSIESARMHVAMLGDRVDELEAWVEFSNHLGGLESTIADEYVTRFLEGDYETAHLLPAFEKRFLTEWLNDLYDETQLGDFNAETYSKYLADFRRLDQERQELAKVAVQHLVTSRRPTIDLEHADSSQQVILRREIQKQRQHKPLRELFDEAGEFITKLKPCFMMSPLSVAQYLKKDAISFDTVIFDEASQVMPEDAVSSIVRANQAIIAGDTKQLPPTTFFDTEAAPTEGVREDLDSILEEAAAILPEVSLTWHYRSRSADLIDFSNQLYYNGRLQTFPENDSGTETGVEFHHVEDGVYDRGGSRRNDIEAERVADIVAEHASQYPDKSLGVVAFSVPQEDAIREALEARRGENDTLDRFIDEDDILGEFFVKNLEMVQGDERDRMLFSVGYGPDQNGEVSMNFGPLNQQGGERRLNVAITRARERVTVVSSLLPEQIDLSRTSSTGVEHFKRYLEYAKDGRQVLAASQNDGVEAEIETALEESVYAALTEHGYEVDTVSSSGYSLDLAISTGDSGDGYDLGIEFDASAYRWSNTARDRDRIRPSVLEALGWDVHRIWAPDWVTNRERVLKEIDSLTEREKDTGSNEDPLAALDPDEEFEVETHEPEEYSREELDAMRADVETYRGPSPDRTMDSGVEGAAPEKLYQTLQSVVLEYGPIHREVAFRVIAEKYGEPRRTQTVKEALSEQLAELEADRQVTIDDEFLWPQRQDVSLVVRTNEESSRSVDRIPIAEIALGVALILDAGFSMTRDDLVIETTRLFGYERVGSRIRDRVNQAIDRLQDEGLVSGSERLSLDATLTEVRVALLEGIYD